MLTLVYATHPSQYFDAMMESAKKYGYNVKVLGWKTKWKGFADKFYGVYQFIKDYPDKEEIILFADAYDVIFCNDASKLKDRYLQNFKQVTFNSEALPKSHLCRLVWEKSYDVLRHPPSKTKYRTINSGVYIGKVRDIEKIMSSIIKSSKNFDDQRVLYQLYSKNKIKLEIDSNCQLFTTINSFNNELIIKNNRIYNRYTQTYPFVVHAPGKHTSLDQYIDCLGLKNNTFRKGKIIGNIKGFLANYLDFLIIMIICLVLLKGLKR